MSYLIQASNAFFEVCSLLAHGIQAVTKGTRYIIQLNYNVVATVYTVINTTISVIAGATQHVWSGLQNTAGYFKEFVHELYGFVSIIVFCVWKFIVGVFELVDSSCMKVSNFFLLCANLTYHVFVTMKQTAVSGYETVSHFFYVIINNIFAAVASVFFFVTSVGSLCVNVVNGAWQGLGYVLSSIAYFPVFCIECLESVKSQFVSFVSHAVTETPKETYLGIICLCLVYFVLSNTPRHFSYRGLLPFSSRVSRRRRGQQLDWHFDHGFESDYEDLYNSDSDDRVWGNNNATADLDDSDDGASDDNNDSNDSNDSGTVDDDISDDDDEGNNSDDGDDSEDNTIVSEESDSDESLISQTFSTESSDHEIEVQLPTPVERYSLRSRSSTPVRQPKLCSSPEDFDREMERERDKRKCVVCQDQIKSVLVLPCRHMCMCVDCADHIVRSRLVGRRVCPLCRTRIQKVMNVYV